jgi:hypothetical protein
MKRFALADITRRLEVEEDPETRGETLIEALQAAVRIELATIPPYLCAFWSIQDEGDPLFETLRDIVLEEMGHLGLACNMLVAVGGTPDFHVPDYPGHLPHDIHPNLIVPLLPLSKESLQGFRAIEFPANPPVVPEDVPGADGATIGAFYDGVLQAFKLSGQTTFPVERQIASGQVGAFKVPDLDHVERAIRQIQRQGEGSSQSPAEAEVEETPIWAHYYRFSGIFHGAGLRRDLATGIWAYDGDPVILNAPFPMAEVPLGGYQRAHVPSDDVWKLVQRFDDAFNQMLAQMELAWATGDSMAFGKSRKLMTGLTTTARSLMSTPLPEGGGNYGPSFRRLP